MKNLPKKIVNFLSGTEGATAVEYAVMLSLIISVCFLAIGAVGSATAGHFQDSAEGLGKSLNQ